VTALIALVRACVEAKWFDEALRFACLQKDSVESQALVAFESGSVEFAERVFEALPVEGRVRLAVLACAVSDSEP
jgi:hypothetical protein